MRQAPLITPPLFSKIKDLALNLGFDHVSITTPDIPDEDKEAYRSWCAAGYEGTMAYMTRDPEKRLDVPQSYPGTKSVLTLGVSYYQGPIPKKPGRGFGRVARYAWGLDYHDVIQERLQKFLIQFDELLGESHHTTTAVDTKPILERALAKKSGLGFIGKNTVLIIPRITAGKSKFHVGSYVFLTEVLLDLPLADDLEIQKPTQGCGGCTKCLTACPTDAFEEPYTLKADKCISYLTIENKGAIPLEMRSQINDWVFGCDVCQDVCPFNAKAYETRWPELKADYGVGAWLSLREVLQIPDQPTFKLKWGKTPLSRAKRKGLIRNACVVAGNSGDESLIPDLKNLLFDPEPLIRGHALWGLSKLDSSQRVRNMAEVLFKNETDPLVINECQVILDNVVIPA